MLAYSLMAVGESGRCLGTILASSGNASGFGKFFSIALALIFWGLRR
jgi:hypothetical protein